MKSETAGPDVVRAEEEALVEEVFDEEESDSERDEDEDDDLRDFALAMEENSFFLKKEQGLSGEACANRKCGTN